MIMSIVYPEKDLKLWYGSDDFRVDRFVILPKYTLLYNNELSTFRLIDNHENLVKDETNLLTVKTIKPYNVNEQKWALGPTTTWFTVLNDSTVLVGTALFKNKYEVAGYVLITVEDAQLSIEHKPFALDSKPDHVEPNNMGFISCYIDYKGAQLYSSSILLPPTPRGKFVVRESVYYKTPEKALSLYLDRQGEAEEPVEKREIIPFQLIIANNRLLIYDPKREQLRIVTTDVANPVLYDLTTTLPKNLPEGRKFGRVFMIDRVTGKLYYKTLAFAKGVTDQLLMSLKIEADKVTFKPIFRSTMNECFAYYVHNRRLFFHDSEKGYIYTTKTDLPE